MANEGDDSSRKRSAAQVVQLECEPTVGFDGAAKEFVDLLSELALGLSTFVRRKTPISPELKRGYVKQLEKIIERMEMIDEHVSVLTEHARSLVALMKNSELALFQNENGLAAYTVVSLVEKRAQTLHVQHVAFKTNSVIPSASQDNTQVDQFHNARLGRGEVIKAIG